MLLTQQLRNFDIFTVHFKSFAICQLDIKQRTETGAVMMLHDVHALKMKELHHQEREALVLVNRLLLLMSLVTMMMMTRPLVHVPRVTHLIRHHLIQA
jgi:hypothetical protein